MSPVTPAFDVEYVVLFAVLLLVPRALQVLRIPAAVTGFALGAAAGPGLGLFASDPTVGLLSNLGMVSVFLLAGLDVELDLLRSDARRLLQHVAIRLLLVAAAAVALAPAFDVGARPAVIASLALLTPSGGFILPSLPVLGLFADEVKVVRGRVLLTELVGLAVLVVASRPATWDGLGLAVAGIAGIVAVVPLALRALMSVVLPWARGSEFAFLVLLGVVCALVARAVGVHPVVGAFVVGLSARRLRDASPAESSHRLLEAVLAFASVFAPFWLFHAGASLRPSDFSAGSFAVGAAFFVVAGGLRVGSLLEHSRWTRSEGALAALRKALPMMPTLLVSLVLAEILREEFAAQDVLVGGIVVYAVLNTVLPSLVVRHIPVPEYGTQALPPWLGRKG
jgi:Kef-type K+ transport system membrane component KefB